MKREVTTQEALTELAAAKIKLESMQQLLALKEQLFSSKDNQINFQIFTINEKDKEIRKLQEEGKEKDLKILGLEERLHTQPAYRFGSHSEKSFEQSLLFDDLDDYFPEAAMLTNEELKEVLEENTLTEHVYAYYASNAMYTIAFTANNSEVNNIVMNALNSIFEKVDEYMAPLLARNSKKNRKRNKKK